LEKLRTPCGEVRQDWTRQPTSTGGKDSERRVGCSPSNLVQERHRALEGAGCSLTGEGCLPRLIGRWPRRPSPARRASGTGCRLQAMIGRRGREAGATIEISRLQVDRNAPYKVPPLAPGSATSCSERDPDLPAGRSCAPLRPAPLACPILTA